MLTSTCDLVLMKFLMKIFTVSNGESWKRRDPFEGTGSESGDFYMWTRFTQGWKETNSRGQSTIRVVRDVIKSSLVSVIVYSRSRQTVGV